MKICVVIVGNDLDRAMTTARKIGDRIMKRQVQYEHGIMPIMALSPAGMNMVLKHGASMPQYYTEADKRLLLGIDSESTAFLDTVGEELVKAYEHGASADKMPMILQISQAVKEACWKQRLERVWIQDTSKDATDQQMQQQLRKAGIQVQASDNQMVEVSLWRTMSELAQTDDTSYAERLVNECREKLSFLAHEADAQAVVLDRLAFPFLESRELTVEWGPTIIDAFGLYLDAAAEWVAKATSGKLMEGHWLKPDKSFFGGDAPDGDFFDGTAPGNDSPPPQLTKVSKAKASGGCWRLFDGMS